VRFIRESLVIIMKNIKLPVRLIISALIIAVLIQRMNKDVFIETLSSIHLSTWALAIALLMAQIAALTLRWADLLNLGQHKISYFSSLRMNIASLLANTLLITSIGGLVVKVGLAVQAGVPVIRGISAAVTDRLMTLAALVALAALAMPGFSQLYHNHQLNIYIPAIISAVVAVFAFAVIFLRRNIMAMISSSSKIEACLSYLKDMATDLPLMGRVLVISLAAQIFYFIAVFFIVHSTGINISFSTLLIVLPVITLIASLPLSIGGWGIREGAFVYGLGLLGVPMETAFLISIQIGLVSILAIIIAGIPAVLSPGLRQSLLGGQAS